VQEDKKPLLSDALADLRARRDRLTDAYLGGAMPLAEYSKRGAELDNQISNFERELSDSDLSLSHRKEQHDALAQLAETIEAVPAFIMNAPEQEVNTQLRNLIERILIWPEHVQLEFR
jgi:hypothetical protein